MEISKRLTISANKDAEVQALTEGPLLKVLDGGDLTLHNLVIRGEKTDQAPDPEEGEYLILVEPGSHVLLDGGTVIRNASSGGVKVNGGLLTHQGRILECAALTSGGGIQLCSGTLNLESGQVRNCLSNGQGGGIYAARGSKVAVYLHL